MRCGDVARLSSAYLDGELDDRMSSALRGHLRTCDRCRVLVEDEAALVRAAGELEPLEPPAELWAAIEDRLADAEIADAERPRYWMWWRAARPYLAGLSLVGAAAAAALFLWQREAGESAAAASEPVPPPVALVSSRSHEEARASELSRADRRYQETIAELRAIVETERAAWTPEEVAAFDARLAELDARIVAERARLSVGGGEELATSAAGRDPLYAAYRAQIDVLSAAAVGELGAR